MKLLLQEKSNLLMAAYRRKIEQYTNDLSMFVEIYITLVIVGAIFSIVMITIMGAISGFESFKSLAQSIVYVFLPVVSVVFIALLKLTSPVT
jgi:archaellum biogenesis protein FlaJ (TadC family)